MHSTVYNYRGGVFFFAIHLHWIYSEVAKWYNYNPRFNARIVANSKPARIYIKKEMKSPTIKRAYGMFSCFFYVVAAASVFISKTLWDVNEIQRKSKLDAFINKLSQKRNFCHGHSLWLPIESSVLSVTCEFRENFSVCRVCWVWNI